MNRQTIAAFVLFFLLITPLARAGEVARWNRVMTDAAAAEQTDPLTESRVFATWTPSSAAAIPTARA